ncbi:hypothetical protein WICPIJ_007051 [Wickerhamomyces pijperi]|uniref:Uncharacterized protein n=1 Tax=Wickerhamomyces pijperi TaxID=599730 RepID=A0A9P8TKF0_WICPI|nr:hypothetical protein WICPIJ_007051 [Wickerhamomyces pijperi]
MICKVCLKTGSETRFNNEGNELNLSAVSSMAAVINDKAKTLVDSVCLNWFSGEIIEMRIPRNCLMANKPNGLSTLLTSKDFFSEDSISSLVPKAVQSFKDLHCDTVHGQLSGFPQNLTSPLIAGQRHGCLSNLMDHLVRQGGAQVGVDEDLKKLQDLQQHGLMNLDKESKASEVIAPVVELDLITKRKGCNKVKESTSSSVDKLFNINLSWMNPESNGSLIP